MDMAMFGASYAAGFGAGKEPVYNYNSSYPSLVANELNVDNFYNFSIPARSVFSSKENIIDFVEHYVAANNSVDDLFILGEICHPSYINVPTVVGTDNKVYKPTIIVNNKIPVSEYRHLYCELVDYGKVINNTGEIYQTRILNKTELPIIIPPDTIEYINKYVATALQTLDTPTTGPRKRYSDILDAIYILTSYLKKRNIRYMLMWTSSNAVADERVMKVIDPDKFAKCFDARFMNPATATLANIILTNDELIGIHTGLHPSHAGHEAISEMVHDYINKFNILEDITHERPNN